MKTPVYSEKARAIYEKLEQATDGSTLTKTEKNLEVTRDEAALLLSARAGWTIQPDYLRQLIKAGRLKSYRQIGNSYTYLVSELLITVFTSSHTGRLHPRLQEKLDQLNQVQDEQEKADLLVAAMPFFERNGYRIFYDGSYLVMKIDTEKERKNVQQQETYRKVVMNSKEPYRVSISAFDGHQDEIITALEDGLCKVEFIEEIPRFGGQGIWSVSFRMGCIRTGRLGSREETIELPGGRKLVITDHGSVVGKSIGFEHGDSSNPALWDGAQRISR
jgi:hypothetical protein